MPTEIKVPEQSFRAGTIVRADDDGDRITLSFSSEEPYKRSWGTEILGHGDGEVELDWIASGRAPLLADHNPRLASQIGVIERVEIGNGRGTAVVRFGKSALAQEIRQRVEDGEVTAVSVGYRINELRLQEKNEDEDIYRVTNWSPKEISLVSIPADPTVGVGRAEDCTRSITVSTQEEAHMPDELKTEQETTTPAAPAQRSDSPATDLDRIREDALKAERDRVANIQAMGQRMNRSDLANDAIRDGLSVAEFNAKLLDVIGEESMSRASTANASVGLTEREAGNFSFVRLLRALADPRNGAAQEAARFEFEACEEGQKKHPHSGMRGISVPIEVLHQPIDQRAALHARQAAVHSGMMHRDLSVGTDTAGGHLVATNLLSGSFIDLLRNRMMVRRIGATMLTGLVGDLAIPRQTGGATGYWVAEDGAATESQLALDQVPLAPKTLGAFTDYTRKLLLQSSIDIEALVRMDLVTVIALEVDRASLHGSGSSNQPTGIATTTGIGSVAGGTNGAAPDWADIVDLEAAVAQDNADIGSLGYLTNAKVRGKLKQTEKAASTAQYVWGDDRLNDGFNTVNGYRAGVSNQVASNLTKGTGTDLSAIFFGNWADLLIGMWSGIDILVDPYTSSTTGRVRVVAMQDVDIAVRHPESFSAMLDADTA